MHSAVKDIAGQRFGDRTAVEYVGAKKWCAVCVCGKQFVVAGSDLRRGVFKCNHSPLARFMAMTRESDGCLLWAGAKHKDGYGQFRYQGRIVLAHVWAYQHRFGSVPAGLELDHLCRNRACVNPAHLEPVTHAENVRRGDLARVTRERHARAKGLTQ